MTVVQHNLMAVNVDRQFNIVTRVKRESNEKLSSGYKINRAADDAAGLSISEKMRRMIRGLNQGIKNTEDGISVCQVADGALSEVCTIIHRMKEPSVHAANGVLGEEDRQAIEDEYTILKEEIDRIGQDTEFNGIPLFRGKDVELGPPGTTFGDIGFDQVELGFADLSLPDSFSICDQDSVLQFTEKIQINSNDRPDILSIGHYARIDGWDYYNRLDTQLGGNMLRNDLGFSMIWSNRVLNAGTTQSHGLKQGVAATANDANVAGVQLKKMQRGWFIMNQRIPYLFSQGVMPGKVCI